MSLGELLSIPGEPLPVELQDEVVETLCDDLTKTSWGTVKAFALDHALARRAQARTFRNVHLRYNKEGGPEADTVELIGILLGPPAHDFSLKQRVRELVISGDVDFNYFGTNDSSQVTLGALMRQIGVDPLGESKLEAISLGLSTASLFMEDLPSLLHRHPQLHSLGLDLFFHDWYQKGRTANVLPDHAGLLPNLRHLQVHHITGRDHFAWVRAFVCKAPHLESISLQFVNPIDEDMAEVEEEPGQPDWAFISPLHCLKAFRLAGYQFKGKEDVETLMQVLDTKPLQHLALMHFSSISSRQTAPRRVVMALHNSSLRNTVKSLHLGTTHNAMALLGVPDGLPRVWPHVTELVLDFPALGAPKRAHSDLHFLRAFPAVTTLSIGVSQIDEGETPVGREGEERAELRETAFMPSFLATISTLLPRLTALSMAVPYPKLEWQQFWEAFGQDPDDPRFPCLKFFHARNDPTRTVLRYHAGDPGRPDGSVEELAWSVDQMLAGIALDAIAIGTRDINIFRVTPDSLVPLNHHSMREEAFRCFCLQPDVIYQHLWQHPFFWV